VLTVTLSPSSQDFSELVKKETQGWASSCARRTSRSNSPWRAPARAARGRATIFVVEKDLEVPMRDGARLRADVFRPRAAGRAPVIINLGSYQKDKLWVPPPDLEEKPNEFHELGDG